MFCVSLSTEFCIIQFNNVVGETRGLGETGNNMTRQEKVFFRNNVMVLKRTVGF